MRLRCVDKDRFWKFFNLNFLRLVSVKLTRLLYEKVLVILFIRYNFQFKTMIRWVFIGHVNF